MSQQSQTQPKPLKFNGILYLTFQSGPNGYIKIPLNNKGEIVDEIVQVVNLPENLDRRRLHLSLCHNYCRQNLRRPHLFCTSCRVKKVASGELSAVHPINLYMIAVVKGRPLRRLKDILMKKLLTMAEVLAT